MSADIVTELRDIDTNNHFANQAILKAADEIERLRSVVEAWLKYSQRAEREIELLRAERDEVRQSYCSLMEAYRGGDGRVTANKLGWGYLFEEDKP